MVFFQKMYKKNAKDEFRKKNMQSDYETFFNDLSHEMTLFSYL